MKQSLYDLSTREAMKKRAHYMLVSRDDGKTFTTYTGMDAFMKATGHKVQARFRSEVIEANGGLSLAIGESTAPIRCILQGVSFVVVFKRRK